MARLVFLSSLGLRCSCDHIYGDGVQVRQGPEHPRRAAGPGVTLLQKENEDGPSRVTKFIRKDFVAG